MVEASYAVVKFPNMIDQKLGSYWANKIIIPKIVKSYIK